MVANIVMHVLKEGAHSMAKEIAYDNETREKLATGVAKLADAFVTLPGGLGTFDEFFDIVSQVKAGELDAKSAILTGVCCSPIWCVLYCIMVQREFLWFRL